MTVPVSALVGTIDVASVTAISHGNASVSAFATLTTTASAVRGVQLSPTLASGSAAPGAVVDVGPGTYRGDLFIDRPVRLVGHGRPLLVGSGAGSVVLVRAPDVTIEGFDIDGAQGGDLARDSSGIHVAAPRAVVRDCTIRNALFGIYLHAADGARVERILVENDKAVGIVCSGRWKPAYCAWGRS